MKKLFLTLALAVLGSAVFAADFDWQTLREFNSALFANRDAKVAAVAEQAIAFADSATPRNDSEKLALINLRRTARTQAAGVDKSWGAYRTFVDEQIAAANFEKQLTTAQYLELLYVWWFTGYDQEIYTLMKSMPGFESWGNAGHVSNRLGHYAEAYDYYCASAVFPDRAVTIAITRLNDPAKAFAAAKLILSQSYSSNAVQSVINAVTRHLIGNEAVPADEMKAFLQNANRKYSAMLLKDKAAWEPIIAAIRTTLETY